ncbi:MAG: hypothetical protein ACI8WM_002935, partial [Burkholderiaceae bacterium]
MAFPVKYFCVRAWYASHRLAARPGIVGLGVRSIQTLCRMHRCMSVSEQTGLVVPIKLMFLNGRDDVNDFFIPER